MFEIDKDISYWYSKLAKNNQISYRDAKKLLKGKSLKEFKWSVDEYIKKGKENTLDGRWLKELENESARAHISELEAMKIQMRHHIESLYKDYHNGASSLFEEVLHDGFHNFNFEIQKGVNTLIRVNSLSPNLINNVLYKPWVDDEYNFSTRIWRNKDRLINNLNKDLTHALIRGDDLEKVVKKLSRDLEVSKRQARTLVQTESAYFAERAREETLKDLGVDKYEIIATLDMKTSDICQGMDGKVFNTSEKQIGTNAPPFHVNCRSTTAPYFDDEFTLDETRVARDENGKVYEVPSDMTYEEWKEKYVDKKANSEYNENEKNKKKYDNVNTIVEIGENEYLEFSEECKSLCTADELFLVNRRELSNGDVRGYFQTANSFKINAALKRNEFNSLDSDDQNVVNILMGLTKRVKTKKNYLLYRFDSVDCLSSYFNEPIDKLVGKVKNIEVELDKMFSTSMIEERNIFSFRPVKWEILAHKDSNIFANGYIEESEALIPYKSRLKITNISKKEDKILIEAVLY